MSFWEVVLVIIVISIIAFIAYKMIKAIVKLIVFLAKEFYEGICCIFKFFKNMIYIMLKYWGILLPFASIAGCAYYNQYYVLSGSCVILYLFTLRKAFRYSVKKEIKSVIKKIILDDGILDPIEDILLWYKMKYSNNDLSFYNDMRIGVAKNCMTLYSLNKIKKLLPETELIEVNNNGHLVYFEKKTYDKLTSKIKNKVSNYKIIERFLNKKIIHYEQTTIEVYEEFAINITQKISNWYAPWHKECMYQMASDNIKQYTMFCIKELLMDKEYYRKIYKGKEFFFNKKSIIQLGQVINSEDIISLQDFSEKLNDSNIKKDKGLLVMILKVFEEIYPPFSFSLIQEGKTGNYLLGNNHKQDDIAKKYTCDLCRQFFLSLTSYGNEKYCDECLRKVKEAEEKGEPIKKRMSKLPPPAALAKMPPALRAKMEADVKLKKQSKEQKTTEQIKLVPIKEQWRLKKLARENKEK